MIQQLDSVDSTNEHAFRELGRGRAVHLSAWIAKQQTAGRGRRGASWHGAPDESLLMSLAVIGNLPAPAMLSMTVAVTLLAAFETLGLDPGRVLLDWPNDLVAATPGLCSQGGYSGGVAMDELPKLAGILIEARDFDPGAAQYVCGIGINLRGKLPPQLLAERPACTLADLGLDTTAIELATAVQVELADQLELCTSAPDQLCRDYTKATGLLGSKVQLELASGTATGQLIRIEPGGAMLQNNAAERVTFPLEHILALRPSDPIKPR